MQHYVIRLKSPMGIKDGTAAVQPEKGRLVLRLLGGDNLFTGSFLPEGRFDLSGGVSTAVEYLPGRLEGTVWTDGIRGVLRTEAGNFPFEGEAVPLTDRL